MLRLMLGVMAIAGGQPAPAPRTLLAVFAHPDDESTAAGTLARYASSGVRVVIATVTSGQKGGPEPGDALGARREAELAAACRELGVNPPVLFRFMDGTVATERQDEIAARIRRVIRDVRPQVVVTFGPDGVTGHPDHIAVGKLTAAVFAEETRRPGGPSRLYQVAIPRTMMVRIAPVLAGHSLSEPELRQVADQAVADQAIAAIIDITDLLAVKRRAAARHESQFPAGPRFDQWLAAFGSEPREYFVQASPKRTATAASGDLQF